MDRGPERARGSKLEDCGRNGRVREEGPGALVSVQGHRQGAGVRRPGRKRVETSEEERETILAAQTKYEVNALALERVILKRAIEARGKPASILTDRGTQFYASETEERERGTTVFERYLVEKEIRHVLGRVSHPQTNGKVERFFRTVKDKQDRFASMERLMEWCNTVRPHMSLNLRR